MENNWRNTAKTRPIGGTNVIWTDPEGKEVTGKYNGDHNRWILDDGTCIYYDPLMWKYQESQPLDLIEKLQAN